MNKKIFKFVIIILAIIIICNVMIYINKTKGYEFPHYKQSFFKLNGSIYVIKDMPFKLPLIFTDANEWSEMASVDNIKALSIFDNKGQKLDVKKFQIINKNKEDNYIIRNIDVEIVCGREEIVVPKKLEIIYKDDKIKNYDFGDFTILCNSRDYYGQNIGEIPWDINPIVAVLNKNEFPYSGLSLFIKSQGKNIQLKSIDLGINDFAIDYKNIRVYKGEYDLNKIMNQLEQGIKLNEQWSNSFKEIKIVDSFEMTNKDSKFQPIEISEEGTNILIPLMKLHSTDMSGIKIFNVKMELEIDGQKKSIFKFEPFYVVPSIRDKDEVYKFLQEEGI